jgi:hypothetical protein
MDDLVHGRTAALGGQLLQGAHGGPAPDVSHACRHRSCPKCHGHETEAWLAERRPARLSVPSVHGVFTRPHARRALVRRHQKDLDDIWLRAAAQALITRAAAPHAGGGVRGVLGVLPTWTRALVDHPHVHGLVPAGGIAAERPAGRPARQPSRVPVRALSKRFRGLFLDRVRRERPDLAIPASVWTMAWVVSGKPAGPGPAQVLRSVGRSVPRIALTKSRRRSLENGQVCCRDQVSQDPRGQTMTLPALECIRRFRPHG